MYLVGAAVTHTLLANGYINTNINTVGGYDEERKCNSTVHYLYCIL